MIFNLYKQRGETPLECMERFRHKLKSEEKLVSKDDKWTYLGRLDPMAEGVLLVANDEDVKNKEKYLKLDKDYDFFILFGFATDSYDVLGKVLKKEKVENVSDFELLKIAKIYEGEHDQKYPEYSSKMIAKRKNLSPTIQTYENEIKKITIYKLRFNKLEKLSAKELFGRLLMDISKVKGDFRQAEILNLWKEILINSNQDKNYMIAKFSAHVSSGTYIRSLVNNIGKTLGCGATTLSIRRTRVGDFKIEDSIL